MVTTIQLSPRPSCRLPYHAKNEYTTRPANLKMNGSTGIIPKTGRTYHTRYVTPEVFKNACGCGASDSAQ